MKLISLALGLTAVVWAQPKGIEGNWQGTLNAKGVKLRLGLHVSRNAAGEYIAKLDSIDQGHIGIPMGKTTYVEGVLHTELPAAQISFEGKLNPVGDQIEGTFTQGATMPLIFNRVDQVETAKRPQTPKPPFPYEAVEVIYENKPGAVKLAGTLTLPSGAGPFPAAIMITGSGPQDRDETILGHKPFLIIADSLTRRGIAVLRADDRGVGQSTGKSSSASLEDMVGDVLSGIEFLKNRKEIDSKHIGVIGHSEGGIVGPLAALRSEDIHFVVMLAGPGVNLEQVLYKQGELVQRAAGVPEQSIAANRVMQGKLIAILKSEPDEKVAAEKMRAAGASDAQITPFNSQEIRSLLTHDPEATFRKLKTPVLALIGARDLQVPPDQNIPPIAAALSAAGNSDFTVSVLPGLNHLFQTCKICTVADYGLLEESFSPVALEVIGDWVKRHVR